MEHSSRKDGRVTVHILAYVSWVGYSTPSGSGWWGGHRTEDGVSGRHCMVGAI